MNQLSFIDLLSIASFVISLQNLDENMNQSDKQDLQQDLADKADMLLKEIHKHLEEQDEKINEILRRLSNDTRRNIQQTIIPHDQRNDDT